MACALLVAACMQDLVPLQGIGPGLPVLGARSLTHWTIREVLVLCVLFFFSGIVFLISHSTCSLQAYMKAVDFCILTLYPYYNYLLVPGVILLILLYFLYR